MPFKYINRRIIEVRHETVFGRCVEVSGISRLPISPFDKEICYICERPYKDHKKVRGPYGIAIQCFLPKDISTEERKFYESFGFKS